MPSLVAFTKFALTQKDRDYMRTIIICLFWLLFTNLYAQNNIEFNKDHHLIEAELKSRALQRTIQLKKDLPKEDGRGYDVKYYCLTMDITPASFSMTNSVTVKAISKQQNLTDVWLDFESYLTVDSVNNASGMLAWTHSNGSLVVTLTKAYNIDEPFTFTVFYHGRTDFAIHNISEASFGQTKVFGRDHIWSLSEPYGAREWWPCKDTPLDKADSVDLYYTVPNGMSAAGNGILVSENTNNGRTTFHWKEKYPIATYLVSIAAYAYKRYEDRYVSQGGDTLPIMFFVAPENYDNTVAGFSSVKTMIKVFAGLFGEYPFMDEKYGQAEASIGGGMEHQTITTLGPIERGLYPEDLIVHELAHQWWGDMVTCASFHDIWLNEGFATYAEALWVEQQYGYENYKNYIAASAYYGGGSIYVNDTTNAGAIFNGGLSYNKASYVLHMLRGVVGDSTFFEILKAWYSNPGTKYKSAYTKDFKKVCEQVSGKNLDKFFQEWIYGEYFPVYSYGYKVSNAKDGGYNITLYIDQKQTNTGLFWMPIGVRVFTNTDTLNFTVRDSLENQQFTFFSENKPQNLLIDPDDWILKKTLFKLIDPTLDKGTLLVNGMSWGLKPVADTYENKAFWGDAPVTFWDIEGMPADGYPESLPEPKGQGELLTQQLGQYSTIIWLSSNTLKDNGNWKNLPIDDYLNAGGNVILITQSGSSFIDDNLKEYLGISWDAQLSLRVQNFISTFKGLTSMNLSSSMVLISLFDTLLTRETSTLLFKTTEGFENAKGAGVWSHPSGEGHFIYLAARPWMLDSEQLKQNMTYILSNFLNEPVASIDNKKKVKLPEKFEISNIYPNPFNPSTQIEFSLPEQGNVTIKIFDITGKEAAELIKNKIFNAGKHTVKWNAANFSSGIYFIWAEINKLQVTRKAILMK